MEEHVLQNMAMSPPHQWAEIRRRSRIISAYLRIERPSTMDAARHGAALGIGQRLFYNLARIHRERRNGAAIRPSELGRAYSVPAEVGSIIERAIEAAGPTASDAEIRRLVVSDCGAAGLAPPSPNAVWVRTGRPPPVVDLSGKLRIDAQYAVDVAPLALRVRGRGKEAVVHLLAVMRTRDGVIERHSVTAGPPTSEDVAPLTALAADCAVAMPAHLRALCAPEHRDRHTHLPRFPAGAAIRAVFGLRVGRIRIARRSPHGGPRDGAPVGIETASSVMDEIVRMRNAEIASAPTRPDD